jgi:iron-sulfur cluster repair protein YtfE (RIC family)
MIQIGAPSATLDSPVEHLMACHRRIEQRLDTLVYAVSHLASDRTAALGAISASLLFLDTSGVLHTEDEEESLFPRLRPKLSVAETDFIDSLEAEHGEAERIYSELKDLASQITVPEACSAILIDRYRACAERLRTLYRAHIGTEDRILTAIANRCLDDSELSEISREMRERRASRS